MSLYEKALRRLGVARIYWQFIATAIAVSTIVTIHMIIFDRFW